MRRFRVARRAWRQAETRPGRSARCSRRTGPSNRCPIPRHRSGWPSTRSTGRRSTSSSARPHPARRGARTIYLQPVDTVGALSDTCLSTLAAFAAAFFQLDVRVRPPLALDPSSLVTRAAPDTGTPQVYAGDILARLYADKPSDAFCVLGITAHDLFPHPIVSFAFGEASATCRVGVVQRRALRAALLRGYAGLSRGRCASGAAASSRTRSVTWPASRTASTSAAS